MTTGASLAFYRLEIVGNMACLPAQGIMHPNWSDLAGQRPGDSLARLGLREGPALLQPGGWNKEWPRGRRPVPVERKGRATAAPGHSRCCAQIDLERCGPITCPSLSYVLGGIERRERTAFVWGRQGERSRRKRCSRRLQGVSTEICKCHAGSGLAERPCCQSSLSVCAAGDTQHLLQGPQSHK